MSKNITIAEGKTGKNFLNVSKLKIKTTDGDSSTWVPEDEASSYAKLDTKTITENGTYNAKDDSVDGYSSVMVNVEDNLIEKTVTENGTYDPKDDKATGYSKIIVNVKSGGGILIADLGVSTAIIISPVLISDDIATTA